MCTEVKGGKDLSAVNKSADRMLLSTYSETYSLTALVGKCIVILALLSVCQSHFVLAGLRTFTQRSLSYYTPPNNSLWG